MSTAKKLDPIRRRSHEDRRGLLSNLRQLMRMGGKGGAEAAAMYRRLLAIHRSPRHDEPTKQAAFKALVLQWRKQFTLTAKPTAQLQSSTAPTDTPPTQS